MDISSKRLAQLQAMLNRLGLPPARQPILYHLALIHPSYTPTGNLGAYSPTVANYERLEFLGDAVLKLMVSQILYERFPLYREGELTKIRAMVVSDSRLAQLANRLGLGNDLLIGASEKHTGGRKKQSTLACAMEALLGAIYMDGHTDALLEWMRINFETDVVDADENKSKDNFKAVLQELTQADGAGRFPNTHSVSVTGPSHQRMFTEAVILNDEVLGEGTAPSKKEAQQAAAKMALISLGQAL
jgi:ribonuclease III